jgi:hypothetical protein
MPKEQVSQPVPRHQVTKPGLLREPELLQQAWHRARNASLLGPVEPARIWRLDRRVPDGQGGPPSLFKLIHGIVRETDSLRPRRAQHMKNHVQTIEINS